LDKDHVCQSKCTAVNKKVTTQTFGGQENYVHVVDRAIDRNGLVDQYLRTAERKCLTD
jgi:hypothetical protein